jgi:hypothetical protein
MVESLPPQEFNPTVFCDDLPQWGARIRVECFGKEVAHVVVDPSRLKNPYWGKVVQRWARIMIYRAYLKWKIQEATP